MSRRGAAVRFGVSESAAINWVKRVERTGLRATGHIGGYKPMILAPHQEFLEAVTRETRFTLQGLCDRLAGERGVKADTSLMSRFFRRIGVTLKKRPLSPASKTGLT